MAVIGKFIVERNVNPNSNNGVVVADVAFSNECFRLRSYKFGDDDRTEGSKQNIQLNREKAIELRNLLDEFINQTRTN